MSTEQQLATLTTVVAAGFTSVSSVMFLIFGGGSAILPDLAGFVLTALAATLPFCALVVRSFRRRGQQYHEEVSG